MIVTILTTLKIELIIKVNLFLFVEKSQKI